MPRASGRDIAEIFGFAPDDNTEAARKQWKSQQCPFVRNQCIKHSHPRPNEQVVIYGTCSVLNRGRREAEEVIICPQRLYANNYKIIKDCLRDAKGVSDTEIYVADEYSQKRLQRKLPSKFGVILGQNSSGEITLTGSSRNDEGSLKQKIDWVLVYVEDSRVEFIIPCEVQSIDITGNYIATWEAYAQEKPRIPDSGHGMNWANVWKRLIPQLIFKGAIASASRLCTKGLYFAVPRRVYREFQKWVGDVPQHKAATEGMLSVMTYELGPPVAPGNIREIQLCEIHRSPVSEFARAFGSGEQVRTLGPMLDTKVLQIFHSL